MISLLSGTRIWLVAGVTDMRKPFNGLGERKRFARTVLIFTERSDQLFRATDRLPGLSASPK
ncbi:transposase [Escherichia coli]|nr:transposase [Escherichia coli]